LGGKLFEGRLFAGRLFESTSSENISPKPGGEPADASWT
jgi:hypothetical protein